MPKNDPTRYRAELVKYLEWLKTWETEAIGKLETAQDASKQQDLVNNVGDARRAAEKLIESATLR